MEKIKCEHPLTCKQFVEEFNAISEDYSALVSDRDVVIAYRDDYLQSSLWGRNPSTLSILEFDAQYWLFEHEDAYSWQELMLMAKLAANPPMFRNPPKEREND